MTFYQLTENSRVFTFCYFTLPSFVNGFFSYTLKKLFNLYLRIPTVLRHMDALKKGTCVQINNAKSLLSPLDSCPMLLVQSTKHAHKYPQLRVAVSDCQCYGESLSFLNNSQTE